MSNRCALRLKHPYLYTEPAPGHLHQGGILISGEKINKSRCVWRGGGFGWEACNRFLMCTVLSVSLSKSIIFSKKGRGWKAGRECPPLALALLISEAPSVI